MTGALPPSLEDPQSLHLADRRPLPVKSTVTLDTQGESLDYLLIWITHAPPGVTAGKLGISEVSAST